MELVADIALPEPVRRLRSQRRGLLEVFLGGANIGRDDHGTATCWPTRLKITLSSTDDVATKHTVTWSRSQSEGELKLILKHNVAKYGTHDKEVNYYTQNIYDKSSRVQPFG